MKLTKRNLNIRTKLFLFAVIVVVVFAAIVYGMVIPLVEKEKYAEREATLLAVVDSAISLMQFYEDSIRTYKWKNDESLPRTREEARDRVVSYLRQVRYGEGEHIFILDGSSRMVMHPLKPEIEGKSMADVLAPDGSIPFSKMAIQAQRMEAVFIKYTWLSKWSMTVYEPQTTCARYFYPWDWVVCSSMYTQDIVDDVRVIKLRTTLYIGMGFLIGLGILYIFSLFITRPLVTLAHQVRQIGDFRKEKSNHIITVRGNDEVGQLSEAFRNTLGALRETINELRASEEKYRQLIENANDAIFIAQEGRIVFSNKRTSEMMGYDADELMATPFLEFIHPDDQNMVLDRHVRRLRGEANLPNTYSFKIVKKDQTDLTVQLSTVKILWNGNPATLNFVQDITEQKRLEVSLQKAQKMEAIGTLAGGVAHDFNNILMGIQGRTSLMAVELPATHSHREHLSAIEDYIQNASDLTRQLLGVARGGKYEAKPTEINKMVGKVSKLFGRTKKELSIFTTFYEPSPVVEVDRKQIEQVLLNLFINAWQAMPNGGELYLQTENVSLDATYCEPYGAKPGSYVKLSVTDTGIGMDETVLDRIFDPFFTTKEKTRGTGLGLASAYGIIKNHEGIITVYSEPGSGTTFNLYLPVSKKTAQKDLIQNNEIVRGNEQILLVDDEEMITEVGEAMLQKLGYRVFIAKNGREAIETVVEHGTDINLIILDLIMPGMDGGETFDRIRGIEPMVPIILSSGYSINGKATEIMNRGCNGFIQKPFQLSELSQKIREIIDESQ